MQIPTIDLRLLAGPRNAARAAELEQVRLASVEIGFMTVIGSAIDATSVTRLLETYRRFFLLPPEVKAPWNMATTDSNRGWGAPGAEQVDPNANPDYKEVFDVGPELCVDDPLSSMTYYAPNLWPTEPVDFRAVIGDYYTRACAVSLGVLSAVAESIGRSPTHFDDQFDTPMALLRGNYYPPRAADAGPADFGIAPHTDYGCLTLLATDGSPGLEVATRDGGWVPVVAPPGTFAVNFGEMLEHWTAGEVVATPHRVIGGSDERLSVPLFFNPRHDADIAPPGSDEPQLAGTHLGKRYDETYLHRRRDGS